LKTNVAAFKQGDTSITEYFAKLPIIWDELNNFRPDLVSVCKAKRYRGVLVNITQRKREDQAM